MLALLKLVPVKDWIYCGVIVALIVLGFHVHNKLLAEGVAEQQAVDAKAAAVLSQQVAAQTAELKAEATMAEQAYDKSQLDLTAYNVAHPVQPVRLCINSHPSGSGLPQAGSPVAGNASAGAPASGIQQVPSGNHNGGGGAAGPDIASLLGLLATRADQISATLAEYQSRGR